MGARPGGGDGSAKAASRGGDGRPSHPWFAATYDGLTGVFERRWLLPLRRKLLAPCRGDVLDVGCGTGANFPVFRELATSGAPLRLHATEPDPHMLRRARRRAQKLGLEAALHDAPAEALPFADASFDFVVCTLVLCTVSDPEASIGEMRRVLRPGGRLLFMEHVQAESERGRRWQRLLRRPWAAVAGGCRLDRPTGASLEAAFGHVSWEERPLPPPTYRLLLGEARKA